ncbi:putative UDP-glucose/GDP-mannose dehydrogenase family, NAD binding domain [Trypanosoma rangeli]|uniref:UDP-glucose 6-dehydrogenase n=1 Tax=Trypanosoma rangeli TaxID=5698 RepID=A0A3R7MJ10_TRYRA|nr:putative UDP-glucose/GDP-mannose dehydrogenase family, NAD binding domain [Trypanosoma rangeli]RNF03375.1 putative UDP-glucose/GDP-mannose dehydrogenase family, NAD binding domain [Trypanosoma rangeli]|eukprot:RNF03375.1 putative UDP-glucose/GDP-mannose dehydrogenase family, NAD binding domain [Trypanosoma rangeli]
MSEPRKLKIACVGAGYVGGPTMAIIAKQCPNITIHVMDISEERIAAWNAPGPGPGESPKLPIYEPGLSDIVYEVRDKNLFFTTDQNCIKGADVIFVAVNTPTKDKGIGEGLAADLTYVESCAHLIGETVGDGHHVVVEKSTVPVRCSISIRRILSAYQRDDKVSFSVVSNPEFLSEGTAVRDLMEPDRVLIGGEDEASINLVSSIYENWVDRSRIIRTNLWSSELSKLVANAFLAQRISSINSITPLCELTGAEVTEVRRAISTDRRIGELFLNPSVGFGGSCFQKDILHLVYLCRTLALHETAEYWSQVVKMNNYQKERFYQMIVHNSFDTVRTKTMAIMGFAFKKDTGDTRESPAIYICARLIQEGAKLRIYDPKVTRQQVMMELENFFNTEHLLKGCTYERFMRDAPVHGRNNVKDILNNVEVVNTALEASVNANAIVILTEWNEFATMNYAKHYEVMKQPALVFDGRLVVDAEKLMAIGFEVCVIGKSRISSHDGFPYGTL